MNLETMWLEAKREEDIAKKKRLAIEEQIIAQTELKDEGSNKYGESLTISTGYTRAWDQDALAHVDMPEGLFKVEFKEVRNNTKALEEMSPEYWAINFAPLLTLKPKKPSFSERKTK